MLLTIIRWLFDVTAWCIGPKQQKLVSVDDCELGPVKLRVYRPSSDTKLPVLVFYHGGGWMIGSIIAYDRICQYIAAHAGYLVISVGYRLAPEYPFPAAVEDAVAAYEWAIANSKNFGGDIDRLVLGGDSAGGNLTAIVVQQAKVKPMGQVLIYPALDLRIKADRGKTWYQRLCHRVFDFHKHHYLGDVMKAIDPCVSPMAVKALTPPRWTYLLLAEWDILTEDAMAYAKCLQQSGGEVECKIYPRTLHGFMQFAGVYSKARQALNELSKFLKNNG